MLAIKTGRGRVGRRISELIELLTKWAREPLLHFLIIGAGAYALVGWLAEGASQENERAVVVSAADVNALVAQWRKAWMRPPTEDELARMINAHVREKVLYQEAVAMGLDTGDVAIEQRLAQKVELMARGLNTPSEPGDEELREWFAQNTERFEQPDLYSVVHVFFDPEKREEAVLDDARVALGRLNDLEQVPEDFATYGDRARQQSYLPQYSELELRRVFGAQLVDEIVKLEQGAWHGPLVSGYGAHVVRVIDILRTPTPAFEEVSGQVAEQWMVERINVMSKRYIDELVSRYDVVIEDAQSPETGNGATL